jgi:hypothetical protein
MRFVSEISQRDSRTTSSSTRLASIEDKEVGHSSLHPQQPKVVGDELLEVYEFILEKLQTNRQQLIQRVFLSA